MTRKRYPWDVAISYAKPNIGLAARINRSLRKESVETFFAPERQSQLWGKDEREFDRVFGPDSRIQLSIVSRHYVRRPVPRREFRAALREARRRKTDSLLVLRVDNARLPGLRETTQYVRADQHSGPEITRFIVNKLKAAGWRPKRDRRTPTPTPLPVLPSSELKLLGLIDTASLPLSVKKLEALVPGVNWRTRVSRWRSLSLVRPSGRPLELTSRTRRRMRSDKATTREYRHRWIEILEPLRGYVDTALMLALQYAALRRVSEMVDVIVPIAEGLEPGFWNGPYLGFFRTLEKAPLFRRVTPVDRIRVLNAYALLLSRGGNSREAVRQLGRLRALSRRHGNVWGEGQSYINAGVANAQMGRDSAARGWYEKAVAFGRKHRDWSLVARALGNLSALTIEPETADRLLEESERLLAQTGDSPGLVGALLQRGYLAATNRDFVGAARHYRKAASLARKGDLRHKRSLALLGLARTQVDLGRHARAYPPYAEARRIAAGEGFRGEEITAVAGDALARLRAKEFTRAARGFSDLASLHRRSGNARGEAIAMHDEALARLQQGRRAGAYAGFMRAIEAAQQRGVREWVYRSQLGASRVAPDRKTATALLRAARRRAGLAGDQEVALQASRQLAEQHLFSADLEGALLELGKALRFAAPDQQLNVLAYRFQVLLRTKSDRRIGAGFRAFRRVALREKDWQSYVDMHMLLGDYLWRKGGRERIHAYEAYAAAMLKAVVPDFAAALKIGAHILRRLLGTPAEERSRFFAGLERQVRRWLEKQRVRDTPRVVAFSLFPVRVARRVFGSPRGGVNLSVKEITRMLWEEVRRESAGPSRSG